MMKPPNACALREFLIWMVLQCYWELPRGRRDAGTVARCCRGLRHCCRKPGWFAYGCNPGVPNRNGTDGSKEHSPRTRCSSTAAMARAARAGWLTPYTADGDSRPVTLGRGRQRAHGLQTPWARRRRPPPQVCARSADTVHRRGISPCRGSRSAHYLSNAWRGPEVCPDCPDHRSKPC